MVMTTFILSLQMEHLFLMVRETLTYLLLVEVEVEVTIILQDLSMALEVVVLEVLFI